MKTSVPTIRLNFLTPFLDEIDMRGFSSEQFLDEFKIDRSAFEELSVVPAPTLYDMVKRSAELVCDPFLGWQMGCRFDVAQVPFLNQESARATTVFGTLTDFLTMAEQHTTSQVYSLTVTGSTCRFYGRRTFNPKTDVSQVDAWDVGVWVSYLRKCLGREFDASAVIVRLYDPSAIPPDIFKAGNIIAGNNLGCEIVFPTKWLSLHRSPDSTAKQSIEVNAPTALQEVLASHRSGKIPELSEVASQFGIHPRKLQRILSDAGTTFQKIIDDFQKQRAINQICETNLSISEISVSLGYSDISNFSRSFRRWTGSSPQTFRKLYQSRVKGDDRPN